MSTPVLAKQPSPSPILQFFAHDHLPLHLQGISALVHELALDMEAMLPAGPEKSAGLRKLLEAKDCFVRARLIPEETFE